MLTPHRSLSPRGFLILMSAIGVVSFTAGLVFFLAGAWPVMGFFGLDAAMIYWAFKLNYRAGRIYETIDLDGDTLTLTRVRPSGRKEQWRWNPYWVRVDLADGPGHRCELALCSHGKRLPFGAFLTAEEKKDFAVALTAALRENRGGARI